MTIRYEDTYVRHEGAWRIKLRDVRRLWDQELPIDGGLDRLHRWADGEGR